MNANHPKLSRRDFLIAAGCGCAGLVLGGSGCSRLRGTTATAALACRYGYRYDPWPGQCYRYVDSNGSGYCNLSEPATTPTTATGLGRTVAPAESTTSAEAATVILCDRGCRYPDQCARFVDSNGSGICDPSEGVVIGAATASSMTGSAASSPTPASPTATPALQGTTTAGSSSTTSTELVILCDRGCSYPGHCGRYTDSNGTGRCDLSEGIPADQAAKYTGAGGHSGRGRGG